MAKTRDKVYDAAENVKPYVERAMNDEKLRDDVLSAFATAKELYSELVGGRERRSRSRRASRPTTRSARSSRRGRRPARARPTGSRARRTHSGRNTTLLIAGIALGILFNPVTGPGDAPVGQGHDRRRRRRVRRRLSVLERQLERRRASG